MSKWIWVAGTAALALCTGQAAFAQAAAPDAPAAEQQEPAGAIVVTGVRASLDSALSSKRLSTEFTDALVAQDFAKFPDANLAEALQRIPGITVERAKGGDTGSSVGEGGSINVRGLEANFTRVQVNGMTATTPSTERGFSFNVLASELISSAVIRKSLTAKDDEGGLAGTVDLTTYRPLDYGKRALNATLRASKNDLSDKINPSGTLIYVDQFADDRIGIAIGVNYDRRNVVENRQNHNWTTLANSVGRANMEKLTPSQQEMARNTLIPLDPLVIINDQDRSRLNVTASLQARPTDNLQITFDNIYARLKSWGDNIRLDFPIEGAPPTMPPLDLVVDGDRFVSGTFPASSQFMRIIHNDFKRLQEVKQSVFAVTWEPTSRLTIRPQFGYSEAVEDYSKSNQFDFRSAFTDIFYTFDGTGVTAAPAIGDKLDPALYSSLDRIRNRPSYDDDIEKSAELDFTWRFDNSPLQTVEFGGGYSMRDKSYRTYDGRAAGLPSTRVPGLAGYLSYRELNMSGNHSMVAPGVLYVNDKAGLMGVVAPNGFALPEVLDSRYDISEDTAFGYVMARFKIGGLSGNAGLRYTHTNQRSLGFQVVGGERLPADFRSDYGYLLPSLQLRYEVTDRLIARGSIYRSLTRQNLSDIQPGRRVDTFNGGTGTAGNPDLTPFTAYNYDAGLEWYFGNQSLLSATYFRKELNGFVERLTEQVQLVDPVGTPYMIYLTRPVNGQPATIQGLEAQFQMPFRFLPGALSNTGIVANATYTTADGKFAETDSRNKALPYVSKYSYNLIGYYDSGDLSVRLAYAWRDRYATGFTATGGLAGSREPYGQLDFSTSYQVNEALSFTLDVQNLTKEQEISSYNMRKDLRAGVSEVGRRFSAGVSYRF